MFFLFLAWVALGIVSLIIGAALISFSGWPESLPLREDRMLAACWIGLLALASFSLAVAVWMPLDFRLLALPLPLVLARPVRRVLSECRPSRRTCAILLIILVGLLPIESAASLLYDSGLYHRQLISWMAQQGLPPGLALLHYRMGFSSSWLALPAIFDHGSLTGRMENTAGGLATLLLLTQLTLALERLVRREASEVDRYSVTAIPVLLACSILLVFLKSPSPNYGAAAALVVVGGLIIPGTSPTALLMSVGALGIKITVAPAFAAILGRRMFGAGRLAVLVLALALPLSLPVANLRTTGCPAFPSTLLCANIATSISPAAARAAAMDTINFGRNGGKDYTAGYWDFSWIGDWLVRDFNPYLLALAVSSALIVVFSRSWNRAATLAAVNAVCCLTTAPDARFALPSIAIFAGCAGSVLLSRVKISAPRLSAVGWAIAGTCAMSALGAATDRALAQRTGDSRSVLTIWSDRLVAPELAFRSAATPKRGSQNGIEYFMPPADDRCGAIPIPCTPYPLAPTTSYCDSSAGIRGGLCRR